MEKLKVKVVMLPTDQKAKNQIAKSKNYKETVLMIYSSEEDDKYNQWIPQHLYLVSEREIKEGDWIYENGTHIHEKCLQKCPKW